MPKVWGSTTLLDPDRSYYTPNMARGAYVAPRGVGTGVRTCARLTHRPWALLRQALLFLPLAFTPLTCRVQGGLCALASRWTRPLAIWRPSPSRSPRLAQSTRAPVVAGPGTQQAGFRSICAAADRAASLLRRRAGAVGGGGRLQPWQSQFPGASLVRVTQEWQGLETSPSQSPWQPPGNMGMGWPMDPHVARPVTCQHRTA